MTVAPTILALSAFNLVCVGSVSTIPPIPNQPAKTYEVTFRIDLEKQRWCSASCLETQAIFSVTENEIVFYRSAESITGGGFEAKVNRVSGRHEKFVSIKNFANSGSAVIFKEDGRCTVSEFSGFPSSKF